MENKENTSETLSIENDNKEKNTKARSRKFKEDFREKECEVINYNKHSKTLDIRFERYGIRIKNIEHYNGASVVIVKYKGEIGKPNFRAEFR